MNTEEVLLEIAGQVSGCEKCGLHFSRKKSVPGEGPFNAEVMLIGEGPGFHENEHGRPFVGQAGKLLDELLTQNGFKREEVFITNVVKCRPPGNRDPQPDELAACALYLDRQIEAINPKAIVTLGRFSMAKFMPGAKISEVHGRSFMVNGRLVVPMYHPAAALHQPGLKPALQKDFSFLPEYIQQVQRAEPEGLTAEPKATEPKEEKPVSPTTTKTEQLSLF
ncbi:MAG: uracil-DNA glycosylase [Anaerolineaceae bacterium]|nr:uracil-DNA glycosylase [Anaerolineaceae bacterium]